MTTDGRRLGELTLNASAPPAVERPRLEEWFDMVVQALLRWRWEQGAPRSYLQVNADNRAAIALYEAFGFAVSDDYWYRGRAGEPP